MSDKPWLCPYCCSPCGNDGNYADLSICDCTHCGASKLSAKELRDYEQARDGQDYADHGWRRGVTWHNEPGAPEPAEAPDLHAHEYACGWRMGDVEPVSRTELQRREGVRRGLRAAIRKLRKKLAMHRLRDGNRCALHEAQQDALRHNREVAAGKTTEEIPF